MYTNIKEYTKHSVFLIKMSLILPGLKLYINAIKALCSGKNINIVSQNCLLAVQVCDFRNHVV